MELEDILALKGKRRNRFFSSGDKQNKKLLKEMKKINPNIVAVQREGNTAKLFFTLANTGLGGRYGLNEYQQVKIPDSSDFHACVDFARQMYQEEGIVRTVIDTMVDFSSTKFKNMTENKKAKKFFDTHCRFADMDKLLREIFLEYYLIEDVFVYRGDRNTVKTGPDVGSVYYPYTVLNPAKVEILGPLLFDSEIIALNLDDDLFKALSQWPELEKRLIGNLPEDIKKLIGVRKQIPLDVEKASRISRRRQSYQRYSVPFVMSAARPLLVKRRLREMDLATAEGNINTLVVVKVGNDEYPADGPQLKAMAALLKNTAKSYELVCNHTVQVEFLRPDFKSLFAEKYEELDKDIDKAMGMPLLLITGEGNSSGAAFWSLLAVVEKLNRGRHVVARWLEEEYRKIAELEGLKEYPKVVFDRLSLRDEKVFKDIMMNLNDRGMLDVESMLDDADFDYEEILERKKRDAENEDIWKPIYVPFSASKSPAPGGDGRPNTEVNPRYSERSPQEPSEEEREHE